MIDLEFAILESVSLFIVAAEKYHQQTLILWPVTFTKKLKPRISSVNEQVPRK